MLLELLIALTLTGELKQSDLEQNISVNPVPMQSTSATVQPRQTNAFTGVYQDAAIDPMISVQIQGGLDEQATERSYMHEIKANVGCPYHNYADYLINCRPEKRKVAWKRMVREHALFFDKDRMKQFEAISHKYAFL